jgi:hypothetical protein
LKLTTAPTLKYANPELQYVLQTDASNFALRDVLLQNSHLFAYFCKKLIDAEINYEIYDKELLDIVRSLEHWRHYLIASHHPIKIDIDHRILEYFSKKQILNARQVRCHQTLSEFNFVIKHIRGSQNQIAGALSRDLSKITSQSEKLNQNQIIILRSDQLLLVSQSIEFPFKNEIIRYNMTNQIALNLFDEIESNKSSKYKFNGELLKRNGLIVVLSKKIQKNILKMQHENLISGYPGTENTLNLLLDNILGLKSLDQFKNISRNAKPVVEIRTLLKIHLDL